MLSSDSGGGDPDTECLRKLVLYDFSGAALCLLSGLKKRAFARFLL